MKLLFAVTVVVASGALLGASFASRSDAARRSAAAQVPNLVYASICASGAGGGSLDPTQTGSGSLCSVQGVDPFFIDQLERIGPDGRLIPALAVKVDQPNRFTYIYHLRQGVKFSDGTPLTATDVANSLNYARYPSQNTSSWFAAVRDIKAKDRDTVVITMKRADASFRYALAIGNSGARIFEAKQQLANKSTFGRPGSLPIGSGPYKIDSYNPISGARLSINPNYWGGTNTLPAKQISVDFFQSEQSVALAMRAGAVDIYFPGQPTSFAATSGVKVESRTGCWPGFLYMNVALPPFNDIHLRRAVAAAINRNDIVKVIGPQASPSLTVIPPSSLRAIASQAQINTLMKSLPNTKFDLAYARQQVAQSNYPNGVTVTMPEFPFPTGGLIDQVVAGALAKINIKVNIKGGNFTDWGAAYNADPPNRPQLLDVRYACQDPDPGLNARFFTYTYGGKNTNGDTSSYVNAAQDKLIDEADAASDPAKRFALYSHALKIWATDLPVLGLYTTGTNIALSSKFSFPGFSGYTTFDGPSWILGVKPS
jgi:peptide/nickel transport system substrate-binding protein